MGGQGISQANSFFKRKGWPVRIEYGVGLTSDEISQIDFSDIASSVHKSTELHLVDHVFNLRSRNKPT
jgi:hypothetical protein